MINSVSPDKNFSYKDPGWLKKMYHDNKKSALDIARTCNVDKKTILYHMRKHGIQRRTRINSVTLSHEQGKVKYGARAGMKGHPISEKTREKMNEGIRKKWEGHKTNHGSGYVVVRSGGKQRLEHRVVMEKHIGRKLNNEEDVHHINGNKKDNRVENLHLFKDRSSHSYYHKMKELGKEVELRYEYK